MKINIKMGLLVGLCLFLQIISVLCAVVSVPADKDVTSFALNRNDLSYQEALAKECGDLGVMGVEEGEKEEEIRHCANHPLVRNRSLENQHDSANLEDTRAVTDLENEPLSADLEEQRTPAEIFARDEQICNYTKRPYGCADSYCWRDCGAAGDGRWCWVAQGTGGGPWLRCNYDYDCRPKAGGNCGKSCGRCGCSC